LSDICGVGAHLQTGFPVFHVADGANWAMIRAMANRTDRMAVLLQQHFSPVLLRIEDESARHAGHTGAAPGGETHYRVAIVAAAFRGLPRVERSRQVHGVLAGEFSTGLHALALSLRTPEEAAAAGEGTATATGP
jgi:BolA protein